jgi:arsenate reductase-like glutaredoxin family protein
MFDYKNTNTDLLAKKYSDIQLLKLIESSDMPVTGLYAEVCKRFEKLSQENEQLKSNGLFGLNVRKVDSIPDDVIIMVGSGGQKAFITGIEK